MVCFRASHGFPNMQSLPALASPVVLQAERPATIVPQGIVEADVGGAHVSVLPLAMFPSRGPTAPLEWHKEEDYKSIRRTMIAKM